MVMNLSRGSGSGRADRHSSVSTLCVCVCVCLNSIKYIYLFGCCWVLVAAGRLLLHVGFFGVAQELYSCYRISSSGTWES